MKTVRIVLTAGNIRNHHFYLRNCPEIIPEGGLGGNNKSQPGVTFTVRFEPGSTVQTDVAADKMIFRDRKATRDFLERSAAEEGDLVILEQVGTREVAVRLEKA